MQFKQFKWILSATLFFACNGFAQAGTQIYKCTDAQGSPIFSQQPCADDATSMDIDTSANSNEVIGGSSTTWDKIETGNKRREVERELDQRTKNLERLIAEWRAKAAELNSQAEVAEDGSGMYMRRNVYEDIQATQKKYKAEVEQEKARIEQLQAELQQLL